MTAPVVDMHAHLAVPEANALAAAAGGAAAEQAAERALYSPESLAVDRLQLGAPGAKLTDAGTRLADMTAMGVDVQVVGPMPMHHYWADAVLARKLARITNEAVAGHCATEPRRLAGLGTIPLQHPELAVAELSYAVTDLGLAGISISTSVAGRELDDPAHEQVWAAAASLGAIVLIHPWGCSLGARLAGNYLGNIVGQPTETAIALSRIIFGGVLDRHPRLRFCAAHGGGYLPTYIGRSDHGWRTRPDARGCAAPPSSYVRRVWFDSLVYTPEGLTHLVSTAGPDQVVLGTDYPFDMGVTDPLDRLDAARGLDETVRAAIAGANAWRLLGRGR